uniref:Endo/exonuclease/phosphatase domain-containing protein n=1 Tax=Haemonchus contortus TaxID=6289 RepID=A0A7I4Z5G1_HAECO
MAICTFNARKLASEACIEDLMTQARKIKYDVIGLTETRRHCALHVVVETGKELFLGTSDSRGVGGVIVSDFNAKIGLRRAAHRDPQNGLERARNLELIRQRGIARATGDHQQTSELAKLCREAIKEYLMEKRAAVMDEAAEAEMSICKTDVVEFGQIQDQDDFPSLP